MEQVARCLVRVHWIVDKINVQQKVNEIGLGYLFLFNQVAYKKGISFIANKIKYCTTLKFWVVPNVV